MNSFLNAEAQPVEMLPGLVRMTIAGQDYDIGPGDSYHAASNVTHSAVCLSPAVVVDTFNPPRQNYLSS